LPTFAVGSAFPPQWPSLMKARVLLFFLPRFPPLPVRNGLRLPANNFLSVFSCITVLIHVPVQNSPDLRLARPSVLFSPFFFCRLGKARRTGSGLHTTFSSPLPCLIKNSLLRPPPRVPPNDALFSARKNFNPLPFSLLAKGGQFFLPKPPSLYGAPRQLSFLPTDVLFFCGSEAKHPFCQAKSQPTFRLRTLFPSCDYSKRAFCELPACSFAAALDFSLVLSSFLLS